MITCPKCNSQDAVQKVTSIVSGGTYQTTYDVPVQGQLGGHTIYGTVQKTGTGTTELARKLSRPSDKDWQDLKKKWDKKPKENYLLQEYLKLHPSPGHERNYHLKLMVLILGFIAFFVGPIWYLSGNQLGCLVGLVWPVSWIFAWIIFQASNSREYKKWFSDKQKYAKQIVPALRRESDAKYNMLYYCHRDDVVFIPGTIYSFSTNDMGSMGAWIELGRTSSYS